VDSPTAIYARSGSPRSPSFAHEPGEPVRIAGVHDAQPLGRDVVTVAAGEIVDDGDVVPRSSSTFVVCEPM